MMERDYLRDRATRAIKTQSIETPLFTDTLNDLLANIQFAPRGTVLVCVGPTGSGVATLTRRLTSELVARTQPEDHYAALELRARFPTDTPFRWKNFFESGLEALNDPILGQRRRASESEHGITEFSKSATWTTRDQHQTQMANAAHRRGCTTLLISEAHHMLRRAKASDLDAVPITLHQLANSRFGLPAVVVATGSYELLRISNICAASDFPMKFVHLRPLSSTIESDVKAWLSCCATYQELMGAYCPSDLLVDRADALFGATFGCIGWLQRTLLRAIATSSQHDAAQVSWDHIRDSLPTKREQKNLALEIEEGTRFFSEEVASETPSPRSSAPHRSKRRVGERNPSRDQVGRGDEQ